MNGANRGLSQSELVAALGIDRSTLVAVIHGLEKRALVKRHPSPTDRRSYALALTDAGTDLLLCCARRCTGYGFTSARLRAT